MIFFDIVKKKNKTIFLINREIIDDGFVDLFIKSIKNFSNIGLNMTKVKTIKSKKFIELLLSDKFKLFNLRNEVLIYLSIIIKNGFLKSYSNENDFILNKRELMRRKFFVT